MNEYFIDPTTCPDADANTAGDLPLATPLPPSPPTKLLLDRVLAQHSSLARPTVLGLSLSFDLAAALLMRPLDHLPACAASPSFSHSLSLSLSLSVYFNLSVAQSVSV